MSGPDGGARVIVLGALSAIGEATARLHAAEGACFLLAGRDEARLAQLAADLEARGAASCLCRSLDLAAAPDSYAAFDEMVEALGGVDYVYLFYGLLGDQDEAERDLAAARAVVRVNFSSAAEWCLAAARRLQAQGSGVLLVASSVAGDRGRQSKPLYGAAKSGLTVLVQGLAHRLAPSGARAVAVKIGFVDTPMTAGSTKGGPLRVTPEQIAPKLRRFADGKRPVVYAPWFWRWIMLVIRLLPAPIFHRTKL